MSQRRDLPIVVGDDRVVPVGSISIPLAIGAGGTSWRHGPIAIVRRISPTLVGSAIPLLLLGISRGGGSGLGPLLLILLFLLHELFRIAPEEGIDHDFPWLTTRNGAA